jgi:hypothetical protein
MESRYPKNWAAISLQVRKEASWKCTKCGIKNEDTAGKRIQVHHLDYDPTNSELSNLIALCPSCHLDRHKRKRGSISPGQLTILQMLGIENNPTVQESNLAFVEPLPSVNKDKQTIYQLLLIEDEKI